jgi:hypothetical protein
MILMNIKFARGEAEHNAKIIDFPRVPKEGELISLSSPQMTGVFDVLAVHMPGSDLNKEGKDPLVSVQKLRNMPR